jgi:sugar-specific transcriptional regulator TrmB
MKMEMEDLKLEKADLEELNRTYEEEVSHLREERQKANRQYAQFNMFKQKAAQVDELQRTVEELQEEVC